VVVGGSIFAKLLGGSSLLEFTLDNWIDLVIGTSVLAIVPFFLAAYGGHVAAETLAGDEKRRRRTKQKFWGLCIVGILFTFWQQYRQVRAGARQDATNSQQATQIKEMPEQISKIVAAQYSPLIDRLVHAADASPRSVPSKITSHVPVVSNDQLRQSAFTLARNLRDLQTHFSNDLQSVLTMKVTKGDDPRAGVDQNLVNERNRRIEDRYTQFQSDFGTYRAQAVNIRDSILNRLPPQPEPPIEAKITLQYGSVAGAYPLYALADYIEILARQLQQ
jgi:hypothetical protein